MDDKIPLFNDIDLIWWIKMMKKRTISEVVILLYCTFIILEIWLPVDSLFVLGVIILLGIPFIKRHVVLIDMTNRGLIILGSFLLYTTITSFWSPISAKFLIIRYWALYLTLFLMCQVKLSFNVKRDICKCIVITGVIFSIVCIVNGNIKYGRLELLSFSGNVAADPNTICSWLILPCAIATSNLFLYSRKNSFFYCIVVLLFLYIALLTESRGGLLSLLLTIIIVVIEHTRNEKNNNLIKTIIALIIITIITYIVIQFLPYNILSRFENISTLGGRRDIWLLLLKKWWNTPSIMFWGAGANSVVAYTKFLVAHNIYLKFLFEEGIVGFCIFTFFVVYACKQALKEKNKIGIASLIGMLFISFTLDTDTYKTFWLVLFIAMSNTCTDNEMGC